MNKHVVCALLAVWFSFPWTAISQDQIDRTDRTNQSDRSDRTSAASNDQGVRVHVVESNLQSAPTKIRVLTPRRMPPGKRFPVLYLLPVEAAEECRYGDGLAEAQRLDLANKYGVICVAPTFSQLPWYADHPTDAKLRQESYLLEVVLPAIDRSYPTIEEPAGRLLVGFSKSGWGAFSLLLRHPDRFGRAAAWDTPWTMEWPTKYGSQEIFGTAENFEKYRIFGLLEQRAAVLKETQRLVLAGQGNFRADTEAAHRKLTELGIPHKYLNGPVRKHDWHSGWLADVCAEIFAR